MSDHSFTAADKAKAARDEVVMRRSCYPRWAKVATVEQLPAGQRRKIDLMEAIAADYDVLAAQEAGQAWAMAPAQPVQGQLFPPACARCLQRPEQCFCEHASPLPLKTSRPPLSSTCSDCGKNLLLCACGSAQSLHRRNPNEPEPPF